MNYCKGIDAMPLDSLAQQEGSLEDCSSEFFLNGLHGTWRLECAIHPAEPAPDDGHVEERPAPLFFTEMMRE